MTNSLPTPQDLRVMLIDHMQTMVDGPGENRQVDVDYGTHLLDRLLKEYSDQAIEQYIQSHLDICRERNGIPLCKNCGLQPVDLIEEEYE